MSDLSKCMRIRPQMLGMEALLMPFIQHVSSQRAAMFASNVSQAMVLTNSEFPKIASGFESIIGDYVFDRVVENEDIEIRAVIPKFMENVSLKRGSSNPAYLIIYVGLETKKIGCYELTAYTKCKDGFGYKNIWHKHHLLKKNMRIPKGENITFYHAPNQHGNMYNLGVNAKYVFMTGWEVTEDAFVISRSMQQKMKHTEVATIDIDIPKDKVPLNLYGDDERYRMIPDIDEPVAPNGILMALRDIDTDGTFIADLQESQLTPHVHDLLIRAPAGAVIVDIDVHQGGDISSSQVNPKVYEQLERYHDQHVEYYKSVVETFYQLKEEGFAENNEFSSLVYFCIGMLAVENSRKKLTFKGPAIKEMAGLLKVKGRKRTMSLYNKKEPIEFFRLSITYAYESMPERGYKMTGRDGAKGVIADVWEDEDMPTDEHGNRAEVIACPKGGFNRMNPGQMDEQCINAYGEMIRKRIVQQNMDDATGFNVLLEFLYDIWPDYANIVKQTHTTANAIGDLMDEVREKGINLTLLPTLKIDYDEKINYLVEKYGDLRTPITYIRHLANGKTRKITTKKKTLIGDKYIMLLGKIPHEEYSCVGLGHVNQFSLPIKQSSELKTQAASRRTPIRFGEDEACLMVMSVGGDETTRFMGLNGHCEAAVEELATRLLTDPNPTQLKRIDMSTEDIIKQSNNIKLLHHQLGVLGVKITK